MWQLCIAHHQNPFTRKASHFPNEFSENKKSLRTCLSVGAVTNEFFRLILTIRRVFNADLLKSLVEKRITFP